MDTKSKHWVKRLLKGQCHQKFESDRLTGIKGRLTDVKDSLLCVGRQEVVSICFLSSFIFLETLIMNLMIVGFLQIIFCSEDIQ